MILAHRRFAAAQLAALFSAVFVLTSCSSGDDGAEPTDTADEGASADVAAEADDGGDDEEATEVGKGGAAAGEWPRTITHEAGTTEIADEPLVIVSTSITLTGTLLAIDAPVAASAALIIGSTVGADATMDAYDQLSEIAPTVMLDYGAHTWEDLAVVLGEATGNEVGAEEAVAEFDAYVAEAASSITLPGQPATALAYNGADGGGTFSAESSQAAILTGLGFDYYVGPEESADEVRSDVSFFTSENLPFALTEPEVVFVIAGGDEDADALLADPLLANIPAVTSGHVVPAGPTSFRIDFYSGMQMVDAIVAEYGTE